MKTWEEKWWTVRRWAEGRWYSPGGCERSEWAARLQNYVWRPWPCYDFISGHSGDLTLPCLNLNLPWLTSYTRPCAFLEKAGTSCQLTFYFIQEILRNWHYLIRLAVSSATATAPPGRKDSFFPLSLLLLV